MFEAIQQIDFQILDWIQQNMRTPWLDWLMPKITFLGEAGLFWILLAILFLLWKPRRRCGMKMIAGLAGGFLLWSVGLKKLIARPRPCWINEGMEMLIRIPRDFSFPSGHSVAGFTAAVIIFRHNRRWGIPALILAALIAFSRLYLYVHFPTDVLAGILIGILTGIAADVLIDRFIINREIIMNREIIINRKRQRQKRKYDRIRSREKDGNGIINTKVFKMTVLKL